MNKIVSIEYLRFIYILQICFWHYDNLNGSLHHGYVAVEFFFILSGYLLFNSFCRINHKSVLDFTLSRIKRFVPKIITTYLICGIVFFDKILDSPLKVLNDVLCVTACGLTSTPGIIYPLWYISALIIGGGLIYSLLDYNKKLATNIIFPFLVLTFYSYIFNSNHFCLEEWSTTMCFHIPLWRGCAAMALGCMLYKLQQLKQDSIDNKYRIVLDVAGIISFLASMIYIFLPKDDDFYMLLAYSLIIISSFSRTSLVNKILKGKLGITLGKISLDMFILHVFIIRIARFIQNHIIDLGKTNNIMLYIILLVLCSYCFNVLYERYISGKLKKYLY